MQNQFNHIVCKSAIYLRLSREDAAKEGESASIENQRKLLLNYAKEKGIPIFKEYVDDGYSGTSMERPQLQQLLRDIETGEINLVMVKDVSRLGREYVGVGNLLENFFPLHGVRFISVNDFYDSNLEQNSDILPFKNVINEMYAKDTSRKIRSSLKAKYASGEYIGNFAPYGYQKDPLNKNHLIIDEESSSVVRHIFNAAASGVTPAEITKQLNNEGIMPPLVYRQYKHPYLNIDTMTKLKKWSSVSVQKILKNIVYLGHTAQGKTERLSYKLKVTKIKPKDAWVLVRNTHEAIVDEQTFQVARQRIQGRRAKNTTGFTNIFSGLAKCADCGKNMSSVKSRRRNCLYDLSCGGYKLNGKKQGGCTNHFISYDVLYSLVLEAIKKQVCLSAQERDEIMKGLQGEEEQKQSRKRSSKKSEQKKLLEEKDKVVRMLQQVYGDFYEGKFDEDTKNGLVSQYQKRLSTINSRLRAFESIGTSQKEALATYKKFESLLDKYVNIKELTSELLFDLIERIEIEQGHMEKVDNKKIKVQTVKIYFKFLADATILNYSA